MIGNAAERPSSSSSLIASLASALSYVAWLMERDRKSTALKSLQGRIWEAGFREGRLQGLVYDDVIPAMERWRARGGRVAIFSSGSVLAQKLLFGHTTAGDLTGMRNLEPGANIKLTPYATGDVSKLEGGSREGSVDGGMDAKLGVGTGLTLVELEAAPSTAASPMYLDQQRIRLCHVDRAHR